jgi:hypothetical protein
VCWDAARWQARLSLVAKPIAEGGRFAPALIFFREL